MIAFKKLNETEMVLHKAELKGGIVVTTVC